MKGVRFTKAELELLDRAITLACSSWGEQSKAIQRAADSIKAKLAAATSDAPSGLAVKPIEEALIKAAHGKVIALEGGQAVASRRLLSVKANEADAQLVGEWMARQHWLTGPMTLLDVLNKWYQWLPKARATQPPPALQAGLGSDGARPGPASAGPAPQGRRTPQGFR